MMMMMVMTTMLKEVQLPLAECLLCARRWARASKQTIGHVSNKHRKQIFIILTLQRNKCRPTERK